MTPADYLVVLAVWAVAVAPPGPDTLLVLEQSVTRSRRHGLAASIGIALGISVWVILAAAGVSALVEAQPMATAVLTVAGGLFLVWLAVRSWQAGSEAVPADVTVPARPSSSLSSPSSPFRSLTLGVITNLTNPKAAVFFGVVFATLVPRDSVTWVDWVALTACLVVAEAAWFATVAVVSTTAHAGRFLRRHARLVSRGAAVMFAALGVVAIYHALTGL